MNMTSDQCVDSLKSRLIHRSKWLCYVNINRSYPSILPLQLHHHANNKKYTQVKSRTSFAFRGLRTNFHPIPRASKFRASAEVCIARNRGDVVASVGYQSQPFKRGVHTEKYPTRALRRAISLHISFGIEAVCPLVNCTLDSGGAERINCNL